MAEQKQKSSPAHQVLKVLYAPKKAFKEIVQEPKYVGPILILILFTAANVGYGYALLSRSYIEQTFPKSGQLDEWTENATKWISSPGASVTENFVDFVNASDYGNRSISFSMSSSPQIFMELNNIGPVNCSGPDGYKNVSLRIKLVDPQIKPANASVYLFSQEPSDYFYHDLTDVFSNSTSDVWNNLTIPLGNEGWTINHADWGSITGLRLEFSWLENSNITVLVDGLFFRGVFETPLQTAAASYLLDYGIIGLMQFAIQWIFVSGLIFMMTKVFGAKTPWRPIMIAVGFALIILFVQTVLNAVAISTLPNIYYTQEYVGGTSAEMDIGAARLYDQTWLVSTVMGYIRLATSVWIIALCAVATRLLTEFSWIKSVLVSTLAFSLTVLIGMFIGI